MCNKMSVHMAVFIIALKGVCMANVALRKPAFSSSVYYDSKTFTADHGVDGNSNMYAPNNGCFMTNLEDQNPWWMVDLLSLHLVETIRITDRYDSARGHFRNFNIDVFKDNPYLCPQSIAKRCTTFRGIFPNVQTLTCNKDVIGRFIKLYMFYLPPYHLIVFCEFEVQATPIVKDPSANFYHRIGGVRYSEESASETL